MPRFETRAVPAEPDVAAPDGSQVRILLRLAGGSMAHFELAPGLVSIPVAHRTVEELWYILSGRGEMWRRDAEGEDVVAIEAGVSLSIPLGTAFQFRSTGDEALTAVALTMPPWPGEDEAYVVDGKWEPKLTLPPSTLPDFGEGEPEEGRSE
jgi:mannose-6-phosphate isomerase-like protein (cupin superfamily)